MDSGRQRLARASGDSFAEKYQTYIAIMVQNVPAPYGVEENFGGYFHDHDDPALAEDLQNQESIYLSFQGNVHGGSSRLNNGHDRNMVEGYSSRMARVEQQLALDEALARELQESENQLADTSFGEVTRIEANITPAQSFTASAERSSASTSSQELQQWGETIGTESRGLPDELISLLQSSIYKTGLFSKKGKHKGCVICCMAYKNRDKLIKLQCQHQYHKDCITRWLRFNKVCVCT
ncbi:Zinc finger, C3HC4 type (RING finger) [Musa troglodytarum]|uniref:Zinc finger, C3HC4 type (RING finger) n=1 Tax=Musa troglodytarum TaxID=320322 RepID=A0A9E7F7Q7_9LILI|nr:Zinc finger, C3HC4 type (RING finger) [Musa troglodytarum]